MGIGGGEGYLKDSDKIILFIAIAALAFPTQRLVGCSNCFGFLAFWLFGFLAFSFGFCI